MSNILQDTFPLSRGDGHSVCFHVLEAVQGNFQLPLELGDKVRRFLIFLFKDRFDSYGLNFVGRGG